MALSAGNRANDQPEHEYDSQDLHGSLRFYPGDRPERTFGGSQLPRCPLYKPRYRERTGHRPTGPGTTGTSGRPSTAGTWPRRLKETVRAVSVHGNGVLDLPRRCAGCLVPPGWPSAAHQPAEGLRGARGELCAIRAELG